MRSANHDLRGTAADVDAGTTDGAGFNERDLGPASRRSDGGRHRPTARADDGDVKRPLRAGTDWARSSKYSQCLAEQRTWGSCLSVRLLRGQRPHSVVLGEGCVERVDRNRGFAVDRRDALRIFHAHLAHAGDTPERLLDVMGAIPASHASDSQCGGLGHFPGSFTGDEGYPASVVARVRADTVVLVSSNATVACLRSRLTLTSVTPGTRDSAVLTVIGHAAQVILATDRMTVWGAAQARAATRVASTTDASSLFMGTPDQ